MTKAEASMKIDELREKAGLDDAQAQAQAKPKPKPKAKRGKAAKK